jgi:polyketide biosynthesis acyl carrier protein
MTDPELVISRAAVAATVREVIREILPSVPAAQITGDRDLTDLGADSTERVEIVLALIDRLAVNEPMSAFGGLPDIAALVDLLVRTRRS